jgi:hypothetical protein
MEEEIGIDTQMEVGERQISEMNSMTSEGHIDEELKEIEIIKEDLMHMYLRSNYDLMSLS